MENYKNAFLNTVLPSSFGKSETIGEYLEAIKNNKERTEYKQKNLNDKIDKEDILAFCDYIQRYKKVKISDGLKDYIVHIVNDQLDINNSLEAIVKKNIIRNIPYEGFDDFKNVSYEDYDFVYNYLKDKFNAFHYSMPEYVDDKVRITEIHHKGKEKNTAENVKDIFMAASAGIGVATGLITLGTMIIDKIKKK